MSNIIKNFSVIFHVNREVIFIKTQHTCTARVTVYSWCVCTHQVFCHHTHFDYENQVQQIQHNMHKSLIVKILLKMPGSDFIIIYCNLLPPIQMHWSHSCSTCGCRPKLFILYTFCAFAERDLELYDEITRKHYIQCWASEGEFYIGGFVYTLSRLCLCVARTCS